MFCKKCGTKIGDRGKFCQSCGIKVEDVGKNTKKKLSCIAGQESVDVLESVLFYDEDWRRVKVFAISSVPHFDILVDRKNLYLIRFPNGLI